MSVDPSLRAWLADPAAHGLPAGAAVDVIETTCALVFLAGERAIKIKKPVDLGFLDFSTLAKRRACLEAELALNRRTAPEIYLRVAAITRDAGGRFAFDGAGEAVEAALVMKRFDQDRLLSHVCMREGVSDALAEALGDSIAAFHAATPVAAAASGLGAIRRHADANARALHETAAAFPAGDVARLIDETETMIAAHAGLLEARGRAGWVRRLHGDLHLDNIFLDDAGRPTPFDAIEFDEALPTIDVLHDLAFTLMDLVHRRQARAANRVLNVWLDRMARTEPGGTGRACAEALALLSLFLSSRAAVRAHVHARQALGLVGEARAKETAEARAYLGHALAWLHGPPARLVAVGGRSGTGKSTLARALAPEFGGPVGAVIVRTDETRKRLFGAGPDEPLPKSAYAPETHAPVYDACLALARTALAAGASVVLDAAFLDAAERDAARALGKAAGAAFTGLWLEADEATLVARVTARAHDASDADAAVVRGQLARDLGVIDWSRIDAAGAPERALAQARAALL